MRRAPHPAFDLIGAGRAVPGRSFEGARRKRGAGQPSLSSFRPPRDSRILRSVDRGGPSVRPEPGVRPECVHCIRPRGQGRVLDDGPAVEVVFVASGRRFVFFPDRGGPVRWPSDSRHASLIGGPEVPAVPLKGHLLRLCIVAEGATESPPTRPLSLLPRCAAAPGSSSTLFRCRVSSIGICPCGYNGRHSCADAAERVR